MNDADRKQRIRSMIDAFVEDDNEQVELDFHNVVTSRVRDMLGIEDQVADESDLEDAGGEEEEETGQEQEEEEVETSDDD